MTRLGGFQIGGLAVRLAGAALLFWPFAASEAQVRFERAGFRLTSIGERVAVAGRVLDARRRPVPSTRIRWRITDPTIASVTPQGVVVSRRSGNTRLWAVAGADSTSALIVVDQWAAKFEFAPAVVRLDAVGAKAPLRINVRDAMGQPISDVTRRAATCRSLNDKIATLSVNGEVTARANGSTWVRCTDRGIADSVRVEVRQRPARVIIADRQTFTNPKVVGEVFTLRLTALDRSNDEIRDPHASWASLNPTIVSIDPLSGATRAVGAGTAKIVAQVGDVTDTLTIPVSPSLGLAVPPNSDTASTMDVSIVRAPTLKLDGVFATEGEQSVVRIIAKDAAGNEVPNPEVLLRSTDTSIFTVLPGHRVQSKKAGEAYVVGKFGNAIDSARIAVRSLRVAEGGTGTTAAGRPASAFTRPTLPLDSLQAERDTARARVTRELEDSRIVRAASGRFIAIDAVVGQTLYSFSDSTGAEKRAGVIYGGAADIGPFRWLRLGADFRTGVLKPASGETGNDLNLVQVNTELTLQAADYFGVRFGYILRAMREGSAADPVSRQIWNIPHASLVTRLNFVGERISTRAAFSILPATKYTGVKGTQPDELSYAAEAGLEFNSAWFTSDLIYRIERIGFPSEGAAVPRVDQLSTIRVRIGLRRGR